ncbi:SPO22-domain-containing protein [Lophiostoma macrostomum CBS 122681]|uniref:SPO22-domain-containing protein n=1 Tax=Lophiostoma macrostomum CBS 122681 TaxID=1314788 RepID=A0A6A6TKD8_9PLEO|nr:SPO22-domain-containing protein [Lophiostoma macrostomum CBS 122681]
MPPIYSAKSEREKKLKSLLSFASKLADRCQASHDATLLEDLQTHVRALPLQASSTIAAKQDELDKVGTELWNVSTRMRRGDGQANGKSQEETSQKNKVLTLLRVFSFLLLDTAAAQVPRTRERKHSIRLMKVALKAARVCIQNNELSLATKVLERAADYQEALDKSVHGEGEENGQLEDTLRVEYFAVRMTLAWRQDRMDTAEHMFAKCKPQKYAIDPSISESLGDLLYEIGKGLLGTRNYELAAHWLERAHDVLGEQDMEKLSHEAGELRLSIMQSTVQAYMKLRSSEMQAKAWHMLEFMETDYGEKLVVQLLKLELLSARDTMDSSQYFSVLSRIIRSVVLTETNFRMIMHQIHTLKQHSNTNACKALDDLIEARLFREENHNWIEKAAITRIWAGTASPTGENELELLQDLFATILRNTKHPLSAPATHAAQTLIWKRVEAAGGPDQPALAESWCRLCLHPLFEKAGEINKSKVARKIIQCASSRADFGAAREVFLKMSSIGRDEPLTRYLMYKVGLHSEDWDLASESLDSVCRQSLKDATLLYACVLEAQKAGNKRQAIVALGKVLDKYEFNAPTGIHLPALLRCNARLLTSELTIDGKLNADVAEELCKLFEGAKASRRRPSIPSHQSFTPQEFEWFSKNAYNLSLKYCAEMHPSNLVRLLGACSEFIRLLKDHSQSEDNHDLPLRSLFCEFLAACAFTTLARAEDNIQDCLRYYLQVQKHCHEFRRTVTHEVSLKKLGESSQTDVMTKHLQIIKLELEAVLKLEKWDAFDELFEECWKYKDSKHYETLADLILVIYAGVSKANLEGSYRNKVLSALQKIINLAWRQSDNGLVKLSRWLRCLFQLSLTFDESISLKCLDQASQIAAARHGVSQFDLPVEGATPTPKLATPPPSSSPLKIADEGLKDTKHYPCEELEWLATTSFNHAVDYYLQENDEQCKTWAEKAMALAQWAEDGGKLRGLLMQKYGGLVWQAE